jgi:predicted nucleic acid-binding protein
MLRFFDSTGLVKALVREEHGHKQAASLLEESAGARLAFATARIAALEALSKIWRITGNRGELQKLERHFDKFAFYELDADYEIARSLIIKARLKGADAGILSVAVGIARRERVVVQFISADQDQLRAARDLSKHDKIRVVSLPGGLA